MAVVELKDVVEAIAAQVGDWSGDLGSKVIHRITTDTRNLQPGDVFLALQGDRFDGHEFLDVARDKGAIAAIVSRQSEQSAPLPLLQVADTLVAYQALGRWWRQQFSRPVIAVTGSVGKTTTKELIAAALETAGSVLKTQANFNNEIGVPKTLLEIDPEVHQFAVVEMGMRGPNEIALLTQIAQPDIAVITNVGTAHIGRLGSEQAIANAKCELLAELKPTGVAVLNADNPLLLDTAAQIWSGKTVRYGLQQGDLRGHLVDATTLVVEEMSFTLPLPGRHNALNFLAALAIAREVGIDWAALTHLQVELPQGRAKQVALPENVVLLDETYNAGLESMLASLQLLAEMPAQRRIAVLGTMKELGDRSPEFHHQVGAAACTAGIDHLLILADAAEQDAMAAGAAPLPTTICQTHADVVNHLLELVQPGDRILLKASRAVGLDQVVQQFGDRYRATVSS
ncbi:UDP-N-acetylmuramoyl-tripeptide--D-alanyl-D-alanine ligase [Leptolyngbya sp. AN02str]|uniref:UDP-N-acetylmuramoyl-tripeptide--D-alanyl-D- alanine ligase n=1 Tax=Leptolyngbya sp. AN02str TaxID=3423363 RepID=UPI003D32439F